jgi:hypothetical protein
VELVDHLFQIVGHPRVASRRNLLLDARHPVFDAGGAGSGCAEGFDGIGEFTLELS